ncbi:molybdate ABC transporter substrate-binding protein [Oligoflexus tunisiensis]|uniref:molybdate ABC transporter substrate-binding protein n=1 Tax=Oligoflexus tunisiensis TaxID=708132 RepID=UPI000AB304D0|nr:molybdate ABC transporter substrate-binding protein [Oligoflexus tunisiensis]
MSGLRDRSQAMACLLLMSMILLSARLKAESQPKQELMVAAAASLKDVLEEIGPAFEQDHPGLHVTFHFASSGALQQQIEQGAPVDVFISAAPRQVEALRQKNLLLQDSLQNLCSNELVLIVPRTQAAPQSPLDLQKSGFKRIALGEARTVPAGQYAEAWLKNLGLHATLQPRLVPAANVRQVLTFVASGNVSAGIVYASDARTSSQVKVALRADPSLHPPITYPLAIIKKSKRPAAARVFAQFLQGDKARGLLRKHGFLVPVGKAS